MGDEQWLVRWRGKQQRIDVRENLMSDAAAAECSSLLHCGDCLGKGCCWPSDQPRELVGAPNSASLVGATSGRCSAGRMGRSQFHRRVRGLGADSASGSEVIKFTNYSYSFVNVRSNALVIAYDYVEVSRLSENFTVR